MRTRIILWGIMTLVLAGCVTHKIGPALPLGEFPAIRFLSSDQARRVTVAPKAVRTGNISQDDWNAIVQMVSRLPDLSDNDRTIVTVTCFGDPTIAVTLQLGYRCYMITFVKTDQSTWKVAAIYQVVA